MPQGLNSHVTERLTQIIENMKKRMDEEAKQILKGGCRFIVNVVLAEMDGFQNVTGNMRNSIAVGLFYDRQLQFVAFSFDTLHHMPTRATLRSGETYDLDTYWDGTPVTGRPYTAPDDSNANESFWSMAEALEFIQSVAPLQKGFSYVVVSAVDYAKYLEARDGTNILEQTRSEFAGMGALVSALR
ncbi:MAG: HK97 gp10 family phage protein [Prevotella sp.]|nr:HK97 gp10 family phage protein [Prevotella sp.]